MKKVLSSFLILLSTPLWAAPDPSVKLSSLSLGYPYTSAFQVKINFSEPVTGFVKSNIIIKNGIITNVTGNKTDYLATVVAINPGEVDMLVPADSVKSLSTGTPNRSSNTLKITGLDPVLNPSSNFNLTQWILTLPIPLGDINNATVIGTPILNGIPTINTGYSNPPYFFTDVVTGAMVFFAPLDGATTNNSVFPRSQLAESLDGAVHHWKLSTYDSNTLTASVLVSQMPLSKRIVIGTIQDDGNTDALGNEVGKKSLVKLYFDLNQLDPNKKECNGCIYGLVRPAPAQENFLLQTVTVAKNIHVNDLFTYKITLQKDGTLTIRVNGLSSSETTSSTVRLSTSKDNLRGWGSQYLYFQAGVYLPDHGKSAYMGGTANFYALQVKHTHKTTP